MHSGRGELPLWTATFRREELLDFLDGRAADLKSTRIDTLELGRTGAGDLVGIWAGPNVGKLSRLPQLVIGDRATLADVFAWSATYLQPIGPLSAISRPVTWVQYRSLASRSIPEDRSSVVSALVGTVLCETMAQVGLSGIGETKAWPPNRALSFAIFRAWALGFSLETADEIRESYQRVRTTFAIRENEEVSTAAVEVARAVVGHETSADRAARRRPRSPETWLQDLKAGRKAHSLASKVLGRFVDLTNQQALQDIEDLTAEKRVLLFDEVARAIVAARSGNSTDAFALAFAASLCRTGLEQQVGLLRRYAKALPASWLWLGALQAGADLHRVLSLGDGAGWRVARELFRPDEPWSAPTGDIALAEVDTPSRSQTKALHELAARRVLDVEIYPMVTTAVVSDSPRDRPPTQRDAALERSLRAAENHLTRASRVLRDIREQQSGSRLGSERGGPRRPRRA